MNIGSFQPVQASKRNETGPRGFDISNKGIDPMIAALATLAFLTTLWMLIIVGAAVLEKSGGRIVSALKGERLPATIATRPVQVRHPHYRAERALRPTVRMRAAA
ncbi:MAG: hypothetical protein ABIQ99_10440 [Thermoflexales bacterium]